MRNADILAAIEVFAEKAIMPGDLNESILVPEQFERFIQIVEESTKILGNTRRIDMTSQQVNIDRTGFTGRLLKAGSQSNGAHRTLTDADSSKPDFLTNKLIANELVAITGMNDKALRRNLERGNFIDTLVAMFGRAVGRDLEEYGLHADTSIPYNTDDVLHQTDGWLKLAAQKLYGVHQGTGAGTAGNATRDFQIDPANPEGVRSMFQAMLESLEKKYLGDPSEWRYYVTWDVYDLYRDLWTGRAGVAGDAVLAQGNLPPYKGIPVEYVPMLERKIGDRAATLQHPDNMCWGVFHEVTVEPEREAKDRRTDFVLATEPDVHYEDENGAVTAYIDRSKPL